VVMANIWITCITCDSPDPLRVLTNLAKLIDFDDPEHSQEPEVSRGIFHLIYQTEWDGHDLLEEITSSSKQFPSITFHISSDGDCEGWTPSESNVRDGKLI